MPHITSYDSRQIELMKNKIQFFEERGITFKELIDDLRALLETLQDIPDGWKQEFHKEWFDLEQIYAVSTFRHEDDSLYKDQTDTVIMGIKKLIGKLDKDNILWL